MNIPNKIVISGMEYKVIVEDKPLFCSNQRAYGYIDYDEKSIYIDSGLQNIQGQVQTFLHEVLHGIAHDRELDFSKDGEETLIDQLAKGLYQFLKDNPRVPQEGDEDAKD